MWLRADILNSYSFMFSFPFVSVDKGWNLWMSSSSWHPFSYFSTKINPQTPKVFRQLKMPERLVSPPGHLRVNQGYGWLLPNSTADNQPLVTLSLRDFLFIYSDAFISRKSCLVTIRQLSIHGIVGTSFWWPDVLPGINLLELEKRLWNLAASSVEVDFLKLISSLP